ncbi:MAG: DUF6034 family protein [Eubacteriales bacterium]|nr:DUF6034 family protein [Eubacteriales bacterium]MDD3882254.1 DUF6034 family protein [Eubacteriales bacterium]MDD4512000.1 DUF6034 family protein [Eubacteriales bacterium]
MKRILACLLMASQLICTSLAHAGTIREQVNAPSQWKETVYSKTGKSAYIFDADIITPSGKSFSCIDVAGRRITQSEVNAWAEYLFPLGDYEGSLTIHKGVPDALTQGYGGEIFQSKGASMSFTYTEDISSGNVVSSIIRYSALAGDAIGEVFYSCDDPLPLRGEYAKAATLSVTDAQAVADTFVQALYPELCLVATGVLKGTPIELSTLENDREGVMIEFAEQEAYVFEYQHAPNQIPVIFANNNAVMLGTTESGDNSIIYSWPLSYERLSICVSDQGIRFIDYQNTYEILQETNVDAALLPFESIADVIKTILPLKYTTYEYSLGSFNITIHRISLGYGRINRKDNPTRYELVPVWYVFGYEGKNESVFGRSDYDCILMVNAMDGTIIDRDYGY